MTEPICSWCWQREHPGADDLNPAYPPTCEWLCQECSERRDKVMAYFKPSLLVSRPADAIRISGV